MVFNIEKLIERFELQRDVMRDDFHCLTGALYLLGLDEEETPHDIEDFEDYKGFFDEVESREEADLIHVYYPVQHFIVINPEDKDEIFYRETGGVKIIRELFGRLEGRCVMACMDFEDYGFTYYKLKSDIDQAIEKVRRDMEKAGMSGDYIAKNLIVPLLNLRNAGECETNELKGYKEAASHCHVLASSRPPVIDEFTDFNRVLNKFSSYKSWRLLEEDVKMDNPEYVMERYDQLKGAQKFIIDYYFGQEVKEVMSQIPK